MKEKKGINKKLKWETAKKILEKYYEKVSYCEGIGCPEYFYVNCSNPWITMSDQMYMKKYTKGNKLREEKYEMIHRMIVDNIDGLLNKKFKCGTGHLWFYKDDPMKIQFCIYEIYR